LGKRRRDDEDASSGEDDVPEDVKSIPMPRDTPPPIPKEAMDEWYAKRRARRTNANDIPLGNKEGRPSPRGDTPARSAPPVETKTVYEAKPVIRDLIKEAVNAFMPTAVRMKMEKGKGQGGLIEPEEADRLEREGYMKTTEGRGSEVDVTARATVTVEDVEDEDDS
jgi:hypothetical protein